MALALRLPIVQAPMGGGPSTPALAAAVSGAGGLGFLAAGYQDPDAVAADVAAVRALGAERFGVNVFARPGEPADAGAVAAYAERIDRDPAAAAAGGLGTARHDDDHVDAKVALLAAERVPVVSFTFGLPPAGAVDALHAAGCAVWLTVTTPQEAEAAAAAGADALLVQGVEAGGHRGGFDDAAPGDLGVLALLQLVGARTDLPLVAAGGIADGRGVAAVLAAGAEAAALGTAYMRTPEAATAPVHRDALAGPGPTAITRAFTGRAARGIVNRFMIEHEAAAVSAYPEVHHLTRPLRAAARERGDAESLHLWAGQAHALATEEPAAQLTRRLAADAARHLAAAAARLRDL